VSDLETGPRSTSNRAARQVGKDEGRIDELMRQLRQETKAMRQLAAKRDRVDAALARVEARKARLKSAKARLKDVLEEAKSVKKLASADLAKAKRALAGNRKETPLDKMIDDVYDNLTKTGEAPQGILDRLAGESDKTTGRVRERVIVLDKEQRMNGVHQGFLQDDLPMILNRQYDQLSAELGIREALEIGPDGRFQSWKDRLDAVKEDYKDLIQNAPDDRSKQRLRKERDIIVDDLIEMRDRLKGSTLRDEPTTHGWVNWLSSKLRAWTYSRFGGGFLITSQTDLASFKLRHGSIGKALTQYAKVTSKSMKNMAHGLPQNELEAAVAGQELGMGAQQAAARFGSEDLLNGPYASHGIGHGNTRRVTGAIDKASGATTEFVAKASVLPYWNRFWKITAGHMMAAKIRDKAGNFENLSKVEQADFASIGIGRSEAKRIDDLIKKHGHTDEHNVFDPGLDNWPREDARTFLMAIERDMSRAINTPGVGDTPRLMSSPWGKLWLQFQTFAFTFINRYAYPIAQRLAMGDRQAAGSIVMLLGTATNVVIMKDILHGKDPSERFEEDKIAQTMYEVVDRSGILGWMSPYIDSTLKFSGFQGSDRYIRQNAFGSIFGVNAGVINDVGRAGVAISDGEEDAVEKLLLLAPLSTQTRLIDGLMTD